MPKRIGLLTSLLLAGIFASGLTQAQPSLNCTLAPGTSIAASLVDSQRGFDDKPRREVTLLLLPGGTAEYMASGTCTVLAFTGIRQGAAVYTDDGVGQGLTVAVSQDHTLTVTHAAGWTARSQ